MIKICTKYCGTTVMLAEVETEEEAEAFMKNSFVIEYSDSWPDEIVYPDEMFMEK